MAFTAQDVKKLREMTNCGMMDCKKALTETDGDMDKAIEFLREKGLATAAKKAGRIASEGMVEAVVFDCCNVAVAVEVNSETDFVAKNADFQNFVHSVAEVIAKQNPADVEALKELKINDTQTVGEALTEKIATIGENMNIRRFEKVSCDNGMVVDYIHAGGKIGVLIAAETDNTGDAVVECLKNVAMQVAAMNPKYLSSADVSEEYKEKEKEVLLAQAKNDPKNANKPDEIIEKMIIGRLNKELKEVCLTEQVYVKAENKESVAKYVDMVAKENGCNITLKQFVRFETGEGLEKKNEDFAAEVASQLK